jgi:hypothetical protein
MAAQAIPAPHYASRRRVRIPLVAAAIGLAAALGAVPAAERARNASQPVRNQQSSPFGAAVPVRIARVGRIELDLEPAGTGDLRRIPCAGAPAGTSCSVALDR